MASVCGKFHNEYRAYAREQKSCNLTPRAMFQCLDAEQAATLASMSLHSEDDLEAMETNELLEVWRETFGLKSSAAVLRACNALAFNGNPLSATA